jgi:hypothetical protein
MNSRRAALSPVLVLAAALMVSAPSPAGAATRPCHPAGSVVVRGPVVKWHGRFYFCALSPRRLAPLSLPTKVTDVTNVVASASHLAYAYYRDVGCDNHTVGARSIDRRTGRLVFRIHSFGPCYDVYSWGVTDLAMRPATGAFAVIRHKYDFEDEFDTDTVIKSDGPKATILDVQETTGQDEVPNPDRIYRRSLQYADGRISWRRASGPQSAALG